MERKLFSEDARDVFAIAVEHRRTMLQLPVDAMRGTRFSSDEAVLVRVESACTEAQFMACPGPSIDAALIDAGRSDFWYAHEKRYDDYCYADETEIVDEEGNE
jgi:hypothetical protein